MNKKALFLIFSSFLVVVACTVAKRNPSSAEVTPNDDNRFANNLKIDDNLDNVRSGDDIDEPKRWEEKKPNDPNSPRLPQEFPVGLPTQYDVKSLDEKVRIEAKNFGKDEKSYRMLLRTDPDGAKIYRMIGMHVIVNPHGEEVFLPDEL